MSEPSRWILLGLAVTLTAALSLRAQENSQQPQSSKVKIGVYDSRAVAMAFAASKHNPVREKMKEFKQAKAAGDKAKADELREWGEMLQRELHFQGFGKYPVDDYIALIKDKLPQVMAEHDLDAIAWMCHEQGENVELVDVTVDLMRLLGAQEQTIKQAEDLKQHAPVDFTTLFKMSPNQ